MNRLKTAARLGWGLIGKLDRVGLATERVGNSGDPGEGLGDKQGGKNLAWLGFRGGGGLGGRGRRLARSVYFFCCGCAARFFLAVGAP